MNHKPTVLCPVDFSDASRGALRYGRAMARHFGTRLVILAVEDPLLTEAIDLGTGIIWNPDDTRHELEKFDRQVIHGSPLEGVDVDYQVAVGTPGKQILQIAQKQACDLIVMSTHGLTGMRKLFFGSTTERVLRETTIPVLVTPPREDGPTTIDDASRSVRHILVPVDLSPASLDQTQFAGRISEALSVPLVALHVLEPVRSPLAAKLHLPSIEDERRARAEKALGELLATVTTKLPSEAVLAYGDPAEEIAKIARDRHTGLIVVGLHGSPILGPRMGSVTYRTLCLAPGLVLALPPTAAEPAVKEGARGLVHK